MQQQKRPRRARYFHSIHQPFCLGFDLEAWGQKSNSQTDIVTDRQPSEILEFGGQALSWGPHDGEQGLGYSYCCQIDPHSQKTIHVYIFWTFYGKQLKRANDVLCLWFWF